MVEFTLWRTNRKDLAWGVLTLVPHRSYLEAVFPLIYSVWDRHPWTSVRRATALPGWTVPWLLPSVVGQLVLLSSRGLVPLGVTIHTVFPALERLRQEDSEFEAGLDCIRRLSQKQNNRNQA